MLDSPQEKLLQALERGAQDERRRRRSQIEAVAAELGQVVETWKPHVDFDWRVVPGIGEKGDDSDV